MNDVEPAHEINVSADGQTVWVNASDGSCIGRFSKRFGIDVHTTATDQLAGKSQCLVCTHGAGDMAAWGVFVDAMSRHHGIDVPEELIGWS